MIKITAKQLALIGIITIIIFFVPVLFMPTENLQALTEEDGIYENLGALFFFLASIIFLFTFFKGKKRNLYYLLFSLAFLFAAGEEISWGQRLFNFETPPVIEANNAQKEFNLHNLEIIQHREGFGSSIKDALLNFNRLFILFWISFCFLIPLLNRYSAKLRSLFSRIQLPIISFFFGALFLINEITSKALELFIRVCPGDIYPNIFEIKESLWAFLAILMAVYFFSIRSSQV